MKDNQLLRKDPAPRVSYSEVFNEDVTSNFRLYHKRHSVLCLIAGP
jgi:hypothetical protein